MKLHIMRGLPASGKSTKAKEICDREKAIRVNRDLLREMIHFSKYSPEHEEMIVDVEKSIATNALEQGLSVVVDDCNLNPSNIDMWREVASDYEVDIIDIDTPLEVCLERDKGREKSVGEHVIYSMALEYGPVNIDSQVVICDIDGTIADTTHRLHYVQGEGKKNWDGFFSEMDSDPLIEKTASMIRMEQEAGHQIIFVSGRPDKYREVTKKWLEKHLPDVDSRFLLMRRTDDTREDTVVKKAIYNKYLSKLNVRCVYDDRPSVIRMWRSLGLWVIDVGDGIEF